MRRPAALAVVYLLLGALGVAALVDDGPPAATRTGLTLFGALLIGIGASPAVRSRSPS